MFSVCGGRWFRIGGGRWFSVGRGRWWKMNDVTSTIVVMRMELTSTVPVNTLLVLRNVGSGDGPVLDLIPVPHHLASSHPPEWGLPIGTQTMYVVQCTAYDVRYTAYNVQRT